MIKRVVLVLVLVLVTVSIMFGNDPNNDYRYSTDKFDEIYREIHHNLDFNQTVEVQSNTGGDSVILYSKTEGVAIFIDRRESDRTIVTFYGKFRNEFDFDQIAWNFSCGTDAPVSLTLYKFDI